MAHLRAMVTKGQYLERATLIPVGDEVMEGLSHRGEHHPPLLIAPPAPDEGGGMDHVVAAEVAWASATSGHATLRFNFRGVGASQGKRGGALLPDLEAALRALIQNTECTAPAVLSIGGSAPALLELAARHPALGGIALVNPARIRPEELLRLSVPLLAVAAEGYTHLPRAALAAAVAEAGGTFHLVASADTAFTRNLNEVGRLISHWLQHLRG